MNWYYVNGGQQAGPVDDAQLEGLVRGGQVRPETLVWHEGMPNWLPYGQVRPAPQGPVEAPPIAAPVAPVAPATGPNEVICAECGKVFPIENTIQLGGSRVCATCKPVFMQRIHEGAVRQAPFAPGTLTEAELLAQDYEVDIGGYFQRAWEVFKADPGTFMGVAFLVYLAIIVANVIPYLSMITGTLLTGPLVAGFWIFTIKKIRGQPAGINDGFAGFGSKFWQYFLVNLITTLIISAVMIVVIVGVVLAALALGGLHRGGGAERRLFAGSDWCPSHRGPLRGGRDALFSSVLGVRASDRCGQGAGVLAGDATESPDGDETLVGDIWAVSCGRAFLDGGSDSLRSGSFRNRTDRVCDAGGSLRSCFRKAGGAAIVTGVE